MIELSSPIAIVWEVTNNCNLRCPHCRAYMKNPKQDVEVENNVFREIYANHILSVNLSGGEPLLHPEIVNFVKKLAKKNIDVGISTNGWLYVPFSKRLKDAGLNFIQISVDGPPDVHDKFRGYVGAYDRAVISLQTALELGHYVQMNVTLTAYNLPYVLENIKLAEALGVHRIFFRRVVSAGLSKNNSDIFPQKDLYLSTLNTIISYKSKSSLLISVDDPIVRVMQNIDLQKQTLSCSAGITSLGIDSKGNIYPCIFLREKLGNVKTDSISDIWNNSDILNKLRNRDIDGCGKCPYKIACGGCRAFSGIFSKDEMCPIPPFTESKN